MALPHVDLRPQSVLLTFFGDYLDDTTLAVSSSSVIELLGAAGVSEQAARATLSRMVRRSFLHRHTEGRRAFFSLTDFGLRTVLDGRNRAQEPDAFDRTWDGRWTLVSFSLPENAQRRRHELRAVLSWAGFGMVNNGLWAAPREVDAVALLEHLDVLDHVHVFSVRPEAPTDPGELARRSFDLTEVAHRYAAFLVRWRPVGRAGAAAVADPLAARVVLSADWLQVIRDDPRLPPDFLDASWPAVPARALYRGLADDLRPRAHEQAALRLERMIVPPRS